MTPDETRAIRAPEDDLIRSDLTKSAALINQLLPDSRFDDAEFLHWQYYDNPAGEAVRLDVDKDDMRLAHFAAIPQFFRDATRRGRVVQVVNSATLPGYQGQGTFAELTLQAQITVDGRGVWFGYGITNEASTGAALHSLGAGLVTNLPVRIVLPSRRPTGIRTEVCDEDFLGSSDFEEVARSIDGFDTDGWTQMWLPQNLRWRLKSPVNSYSMHISKDLVMISTRAHAGPIPVAIIMKALPRGNPTGPLDARSAIAAACRHHRAPFALHAGLNSHVRITGFSVPPRLRPVPLNLMALPIDPTIDPKNMKIDIYDFLDFDAS
jgi:hypothetical protein